MERKENVRRAVRVTTFAAIAVVLTAGVPASPASLETPRPLPLFVKGSVKRSLSLALRKLESEECRAIFTDFRDLEGRTLEENLALKGMTADEHLQRLRWLNGAEIPRCQSPNIFLVTYVGEEEIYVCPKQFSTYATDEPMKAAGLILHEQLHSLGLGENPPTSQEITRQVLARCGR